MKFYYRILFGVFDNYVFRMSITDHQLSMVESSFNNVYCYFRQNNIFLIFISQDIRGWVSPQIRALVRISIARNKVDK